MAASPPDGPTRSVAITPLGAVVACCAIALLVLGWAFGYEAWSIVAALTACTLAAGWVAARAVPALEVSRAIEPARVQRRTPAVAVLAVRNRQNRRARSCVGVERIGDPDRPATAKLVRVQIPALEPGRSQVVPYEVPTERRGAIAVGPLTLTRRDPLGLWQATRPIGGIDTVVVEPRIYALDPRPAGLTRHVEGPTSDTAPRGTLTFHSLREYAPGDDVRRIHWRTSARTGTLMVREHVDTSQPSTVIVLDQRASRYEGDGFEEAVDVAASVAQASQERGFPIRFVTSSGHVVIVRAGHHGKQLRDTLAAIDTVADDDPAIGLRGAALRVLAGNEHDAIVIISGNVDAVDLATIGSITRRFAAPALVTVGSGQRPTWTGGLHLDGIDAEQALRRWRSLDATRERARLATTTRAAR